MDVNEEILDYINRNELTGALLLTGQWGCGKSYLVKEIAKELNDSKKAAVAVVSLFGLDSVAAINKRVKEEYTGFMLGSLGKTAKKVSKAVATVVKDGMAAASIAAEGMPGLSVASQGLSSIMSYDLLGLMEVKNTIGKDDKIRKFVLVFDDLERNYLEKKVLLGVLNEYIENKQIRVIIIADEDKITGGEYSDYKEKLISRTIKMTANYEMLIDRIIAAYYETAKGYKEFLAENSSLLKQVFLESKSNNLRTLKSSLADFERIYAAWKETDIPTDNMKWALYTFASEVFILKAPRKKEEEQSQRHTSLFSYPEEKQYTNKGKNSSSFFAFSMWIRSGVWDKESFIQELQNKYAKTTMTPLERFLIYGFWSIEQRDIDEGLPEAVKLAYEGKLSQDNLISLLTKVHILKEYSIALPCKIDYDRIIDGLKDRSEKIKRGTIMEPPRHTFALRDQIDDDAYQLYKMVEKLDDQIAAWKKRQSFIDYINGTSDSPDYAFRGLYLDELDDELLEVFMKRYLIASNEEKRELAGVMLGLVFDSSSYSTKENMDTSKLNYIKLIDWLNSQKAHDGIEVIINKQFSKQLQESNLMNLQ